MGDVVAGAETDLEHVTGETGASALPHAGDLGGAEEAVNQAGDDLFSPPAHRPIIKAK